MVILFLLFHPVLVIFGARGSICVVKGRRYIPSYAFWFAFTSLWLGFFTWFYNEFDWAYDEIEIGWWYALGGNILQVRTVTSLLYGNRDCSSSVLVSQSPRNLLEDPITQPVHIKIYVYDLPQDLTGIETFCKNSSEGNFIDEIN